MLELSDFGKLTGPFRHFLTAWLLGAVLFGSSATAEQPKSNVGTCEHTPIVLKNSSFLGPPEPRWVYLSGRGSIRRLEYHQWGLRTSRQTIIFVQGDIDVRKYQHSPECFAGLLQKTRFPLEDAANRLSVNIIFLARPGHYGSSGQLADRKIHSDPDAPER
jgi:hypothetical protein